MIPALPKARMVGMSEPVSGDLLEASDEVPDVALPGGRYQDVEMVWHEAVRVESELRVRRFATKQSLYRPYLSGR